MQSIWARFRDIRRRPKSGGGYDASQERDQKDMNRCVVLMIISSTAAAIDFVLALATGNMSWLFLAVAMLAIAIIADHLDDKIRARIRRFE